MDNKERKEIIEQIERLKEELSAFIKASERLGFSEEEVEKQVNLYLDGINLLKNKLNKEDNKNK